VAGLVLAGLAIGSAATGIASASIPASNGVIHACYSTISNPVGRLRVIDTGAGQSCGSGEVALNWNRSAFNFRGPWSNSAAYAVGDVVTDAGSSYLAIAASTGADPTTNTTDWATIAQKGSTGPKGPPGPAGPANLQFQFNNGAVSLGLVAHECAIVNFGVPNVVPGDTAVFAFDPAKWAAGLMAMPLRAVADGLVPVDVCNPTSAKVTVSGATLSAWRIVGG
jgi:hypothetical protein